MKFESPVSCRKAVVSPPRLLQISAGKMTPYFFPQSPIKNIQKKTHEKRTPRAINFLSTRRVAQQHVNPEETFKEENLQLLRQIEIIFPSGRQPLQNTRRFPTRSHVKSQAQQMMQLRHLKRAACIDQRLPPFQLVTKEEQEVFHEMQSRRIQPVRKIRSECQQRNKSMTLSRDTKKHPSIEEPRLQGWLINGNQSFTIVKQESHRLL